MEEILNALLDAEADRLCRARRYEQTDGHNAAGSYYNYSPCKRGCRVVMFDPNKVTIQHGPKSAHGLLLLITAVLLPTAMIGQSSGGEVQGVVTDPSGAAVKGADITIEGVATRETRRLVSNASGFYDVSNLSVGLYKVTVKAPGFSTRERTGVSVQVATKNVVDVRLAIDGAEETITVATQLGSVDLVTSQTGGVDSGFVIRELPLNGRDWTTLAALQPGVSIVRTENVPGLDVTRGNRGNGVMMAIGGARPQQSSYWLDGINVNDYSGGAPGSALGVSLGVDAIEEFSVITGNLPADYGRTSGGVINAVTREGTNQFHGSAYEFLRNSALDARNYFDGPLLPPFRRNQFGGSLGGPLKRGRSFFFVNYEGVRQALGDTTVDTVLSPNAHAGRLAGGTVAVSPLVAPFLALFPLPNGPIQGDTGIYSFSSQNDSTENFLISHFDHHFSEKDAVRGSYLFDTSSTNGPDTYNGVLLGTLSRRQTGSVEHSHILSTSTVNFLRFGVNRVVAEQVQSIAAINPLAADPSLGFLPGRDAGEITIPGITQYPGGLGASGDYQFHYTSIQIFDDLSMTRRSHSLKAGVSVEIIRSNALGAGTNNGVVNFGSLASFMTNQPSSFSATIPGTNQELGMRQSVEGGYVQDDWRIRGHLTLNLGLRYETATVPSEEHNRLATLVLGSEQLKQGSPFFQNPTFRNVSPRVGAAWDPFGDHKTTVHAAFGQYDALPLTSLFSLISVLSAPFSLQGSSTTVPAGSFPGGLYQSLAAGGPRADFIQQDPKRSYVLQWNAAVQRQLTPDLLFEIAYAGSHGVHLPLIENDINTVPPASVTASGYIWPVPRGSGTKAWPAWGNVTAVMWQASSAYEALNARLQQHFAHGLLAQVSYTRSKSIDTGSNSLPTAYTNTVSNLPFFDPRALRAVSDFDVPQSLVVSGTWELLAADREAKMAAFLLSGWQFGTLLTVNSGLPFTPTIAGDPLGLNSSIPYDFPDRLDLPGCSHPVNPGNVAHYVKLSCFAAPTPSTRLGDAGRNVARGPGLVDWDASMFKNIPIPRVADALHLQFRFEVFNVLNHVNFLPPTSTSVQLFTQALAPIASAGNLSATATSSRQLQIGLKFLW
jgi:Carboxypeptidase regulatory-like domain/TonB dependent receptor/TonB-dependent Receptor Plug Domain